MITLKDTEALDDDELDDGMPSIGDDTHHPSIGNERV
jgi:hypothetical protein